MPTPTNRHTKAKTRTAVLFAVKKNCYDKNNATGMNSAFLQRSWNRSKLLTKTNCLSKRYIYVKEKTFERVA